MFKDGKISDLVYLNLQKFSDKRGWLTELQRNDNCQKKIIPMMSYISLTEVGVARGPHAHKVQIDTMVFIGISKFKIYLWDMRKNSKTFKVKQILFAEKNKIFKIIIPNGVVHAYKNIGKTDGFVINLPNKLYRGKDKKNKPDEIRYEEQKNSIFKID